MPHNHLEDHKKLQADFSQRLDTDPRSALEFANQAVDAAARLGRNDPRRGDAIELQVLAYMRLENFTEMLPRSAEVVRIRRAAQPPEPELEALALSSYAVALFANDRAAESDQAVQGSLAAYRRAFGPTEIQLAQKLENQAEFVQHNMGRTTWAISLLDEAVKIRLAHPESSGGKLAETIQQLTIYQMERGEISTAEANLKQAQALLEKEIQRDPEREENKVGLSQILVLRAGVADKLGRREQALTLAGQVRRMQFRERLANAENELIVHALISQSFERTGELERAVEEQLEAIDVFRQNQDRVADGSLDVNLLGDLYVTLAEDYTSLGKLAEARRYAGLAREILGHDRNLLFAEAEIARQSGDNATAVRRYQEALRQRKEATTEATVFFGTTRNPEPAPTGQLRFGAQDAGQLSLGRASVLVPGGQFNPEAWGRNRPILLPVGYATAAERLLIREQTALNPASMAADARAVLNRARLYPGSAVVFVHGYNVSFEEALQRAAQLIRDLNYDGPAFVFAWPSQGKLLDYGTDRARADESAGSLAELLQHIQQTTGEARIHLVAHSMGNRVLLQALALDSVASVLPRLGEIVLAAPAVPRADCSRWLDDLNRKGLRHFTLYASKVDLAMWAALALTERTVLAGHSRNGMPFLHAGVESIDISEAGLHFELNHDVFASNPIMVEDMRQLLQNGAHPPDRRISALEQRAGYWYYRQRGADAP